MPVDVFQHHNRTVDQHPHGKSNAGQADYIQVASQQVHEKKRADNADGNRRRYNDR